MKLNLSLNMLFKKAQQDDTKLVLVFRLDFVYPLTHEDYVVRILTLLLTSIN